jgi:hypothetical protein
MSDQDQFQQCCKACGIEEPEKEVRVTKDRKFRFDYAWPDIRLAVELNGGIWRKGGGAHTGIGHIRDMEKFNLAQEEGWVVLQYTPTGINYDQICRVYEDKKVKKSLRNT